MCQGGVVVDCWSDLKLVWWTDSQVEKSQNKVKEVYETTTSRGWTSGVIRGVVKVSRYSARTKGIVSREERSRNANEDTSGDTGYGSFGRFGCLIREIRCTNDVNVASRRHLPWGLAIFACLTRKIKSFHSTTAVTQQRSQRFKIGSIPYNDTKTA